MSEEKKLIILLREPPHGSLHPVEGLRMSVAVSSDYDPITIAIDEAVYTFLKGSDKTIYQMHIDFLKEIDLDLYVDKKSLEEHGLNEEDLIEQVEVKEHEEILKLISECDLLIPF